jgi:hypothetical protein
MGASIRTHGLENNVYFDGIVARNNNLLASSFCQRDGHIYGGVSSQLDIDFQIAPFCLHADQILRGYEVLRAVVMKSSILWHIMPCSLLKINRRFGGTCHHCFPTAFTLVSCLDDPSTLKTEARCSFEKSFDFLQTTRRYMKSSDQIFSCINLKCSPLWTSKYCLPGVISCSLVKVYICFGGIYCLHLRGVASTRILVVTSQMTATLIISFTKETS